MVAHINDPQAVPNGRKPQEAFFLFLSFLQCFSDIAAHCITIDKHETLARNTHGKTASTAVLRLSPG